MERTPRDLGRAYLVAQLRKRGLSRREAVGILNMLFEEMKKALARGQAVEFPCGKLKRVRKQFGAQWDAADDWPANRQGHTVEWELGESCWNRLFGQEGPAERSPGQGRRGGRKTGK